VEYVNNLSPRRKAVIKNIDYACWPDPETVIVIKGNRPLDLRWHPRRKAVLYASDPAYLDVVLTEEQGWREIAVPPMSLVVFRHEDLLRIRNLALIFPSAIPKVLLSTNRIVRSCSK
jgi:hypothetical protein